MGLRGPAHRALGRDPAIRRPIRPGCARAPPCSTRPPADAPSTRCRWAFSTNYAHVWRTLLEQAGFALEDIPKQWEAFWSFWCDQVQPAVRRATGRDIWGVGLAMSAKSNDTHIEFEQFIQAYEADYVTRDGQLIIDEPEVRRRLIRTMDSYTAVYRKGCTPPDSVDWDADRTMITTLVSRPDSGDDAEPDALDPTALKADRPQDYYKNTATIEWPDGTDGQPLAIEPPLGGRGLQGWRACSLQRSSCAFLVGEGWLAHYLDFAGERMLPPMPKLLDQPFWLDPSDPHHIAAAMHFLTRPRAYSYWVASGDGACRSSGGSASGQGRPPRRRRGHQPRAGGRRGDRPDQADPGAVGAQRHSRSSPFSPPITSVARALRGQTARKRWASAQITKGYSRAALLLVVLLGLALHRPVVMIPENMLKFLVGVLLCAFGTLWVGEGMGFAWPGEDLALAALNAGFLAAALVLVRLCRARGCRHLATNTGHGASSTRRSVVLPIRRL